MKKQRHLVRGISQRDRLRDTLERIAARAPHRPREINALESLSYYFNGIPRMDSQTAKGWKTAERIAKEWLTGSDRSMRQALDRFNHWAERNPLAITVSRSSVDTFAVGMWLARGVSAKDPQRIAVFLLSEMFFQNEQRGRLKRCPECSRWFTDTTRNASMKRCSTTCTSRWWTLERRRNAGHKVPGSPRTSKRRATR